MTVHSSSESGLIVTDVRKLIRGARIATLATLDHENGHPYASLIAVATATDCAPLFLISDLAVHTRNLKSDARISILFAAESRTDRDPLNAGRVSVMGTAAATASAGLRNRFLARHPEAAFYADFADFSFYEMTVSHAHYVGGFGRIASVAASDILVSPAAAESWETAAEETLRDINAGYGDLLTRLAGENASAVACDPDGFDLAAGDTITRVAFAERLASPDGVAEAMRQIDP
jgi:hypothetical protein